MGKDTSPKQKKRLERKHIVGLLGVAVTVMGYLLATPDDRPWVIALLAPRYVAAKTAISSLQQVEAILDKAHPGFDEVSEIVMATANWEGHGPRPSPIRFHTLNGGLATVDVLGEGMRTAQVLTLRVYLSDGQTMEGKFYELDVRARKRFLSSLLGLSSLVFWAGVALTAWGVFL